MIFSNDVFLKAIQTRTEAMLKSIESYQSKIHQCEADTARIGQLSVMFGDPPEPLRNDKDSIHFFIKLVKVKQLNELVLANLKFSGDLQDFVLANKEKLKTLFNYLELLEGNDDLSDNFEKMRLISDLKYDLRGADLDLETLEKHHGQLHDLLQSTHIKLVAFVSCYFRKQRRERITLLDLRDGNIRAIKAQLAQLKKCDKTREFRQQILELEGELLRKCNETVEKTDLIELILADENLSLYYGFHLLNDLSSTLDEIQVKALNLKITLEVVEPNDSLDADRGNSQPSDRLDGSQNSSAKEHWPDEEDNGVNLLANDRAVELDEHDIWSYKPDGPKSLPQDADILYDGSVTSPLAGVVCTGDTRKQLATALNIDSQSLTSSTDLSFINDQLNGSLSGASSLNASSASSFGRLLQSTNASERSSSATRSLGRSANSYARSPARSNASSVGQPMPTNTPLTGQSNGPLASQSNGLPASQSNGPLAGQSNAPPASHPNAMLTSKLSAMLASQPNAMPASRPNGPLPSPGRANDSISQWANSLPNSKQPPQSSNYRPLHQSNNPFTNNQSTYRMHQQQFNGPPKQFNGPSKQFNGPAKAPQFNARFSVTNASDQQQAKKFAGVSQTLDSDGHTSTDSQRKENVAEVSAKETAKLNTKRCRKERMAIRERKLGMLSCEYDQLNLAKGGSLNSLSD